MTAVSWDSIPVEGGQAGYWRQRALRAEEQLLTRSPANPEQVEVVARAIFDSHNATYTLGGPLKWESDPDHWRRYAIAALGVSPR
jgi:hypothetical protein